MSNFLDDDNEMEINDLYKEETVSSGKIVIVNFFISFLGYFYIKY